jgi:hypothetical protein
MCSAVQAASNEYCTKKLETAKHAKYDGQAGPSASTSAPPPSPPTVAGAPISATATSNPILGLRSNASNSPKPMMAMAGWDVVAEKQRFLRYLAAVLCRDSLS